MNFLEHVHISHNSVHSTPCVMSPVEGKSDLPQVAVDDLPNASQDAVALLCCKGAFLAHGQLVQEDTQVLPYKASFQTVRPQPVLLHGCIPPRYRTFCLSFCWIFDVLIGPFLKPKILWMAAQSSIISATPPSFLSSENLVGVYSVSSSGALTKYFWPQNQTLGYTAWWLKYRPCHWSQFFEPSGSANFQFMPLSIHLIHASSVC